MDEATLNIGSLGLLVGGLAIAAGGWIAALIRRRPPPWRMWFVAPAVGTAWSLHGGCALAFHSDPPAYGLVFGWEAMGVATLSCGVLLGAGAQSAAVLALRAGSIDLRRLWLPFVWLAAGGTVTAVLTARSGYWELGVLPAALCLGGIGPCAARSVTVDSEDWLAARATSVALYGGAVACGLASLGCFVLVQLACGPASGIDDAVVAAGRAHLVPCALVGAGVTASCIGPHWRRAWPLGVATAALLAPWIPVHLALYRSLARFVPLEPAETAGIALPLGADLIGRWPRWTAMASAPCRARLDATAWTVTARASAGEPCDQWLLIADGDAPVRALIGAPGTDGPGFPPPGAQGGGDNPVRTVAPRPDVSGFLLAVRGAGGPGGGLRQLRFDRRFASAPSPPMPALGPEAHRWLRARADAAFATGDAAAFVADPAWTIAELVQVCLSSRQTWSTGCEGWIPGDSPVRPNAP